MKSKFKKIFLSTLILSLGACTNISDQFSTSPSYTELQKSNFNIHEESQLFAVGSSKASESGTAVAQMKSKESAHKSLEIQIADETTHVLESFFSEVQNKNINVSNKTIKDLSKLASSQLIKEAIQTNSWNEDGKEYVVLAIEKSRIPEKVKEIFVLHLQGIVKDLDRTITKVSNDYIILSSPSVAVTKASKVDIPSKDSSLDTPKDTIESNTKPINKHSEAEVYLDDF